MSESPLGEPSTRTKVVASIVLVVVSLYFVFAFGNISLLFWLLLATVFLWLLYQFLWLLYRFVRAHERIAATQERRTQAVERRVEIAEQQDGDTVND